MNVALLRLAVRNVDEPSVRIWICSDGTRVAAIPGIFTISGRCQVMYERADWTEGTFYGYPTRPGGDINMRRVAREFIAHNGCAPREPGEEGDDFGMDFAGHESGDDLDDEALLRALVEADENRGGQGSG